MAKEKFIQEAVSRPDRLRKMAKKEGVIKDDEPLPISWLLKKKRQAMESGNKSLLDAINLALRFKIGDLRRRKRARQ